MRTLMRNLCWPLLLTLGLFSGGPLLADDGYTIAVDGAGIQPTMIDAKLLAALPRQIVQASDHGKPAEFEGVWLHDVMSHAGAPMGTRLRGSNVAMIVRLLARDGYVAVFALAELEPSFRDKPVLLADRRDGKRLAADEGPLRLVVADEARGGRWIRQIERIELVTP